METKAKMDYSVAQGFFEIFMEKFQEKVRDEVSAKFKKDPNIETDELRSWIIDAMWRHLPR